MTCCTAPAVNPTRPGNTTCWTSPARPLPRFCTTARRRFARRYKPDLVKFDFGYEIPALDTVAPHDMNWAGERMLWKGLDVVTKAMREENPDIVVMYYELSPLVR